MCSPSLNLASKQNRLESRFLKIIELRIQDKQLSLNKQEAHNKQLDQDQLHHNSNKQTDLNQDKCSNSKTDLDQFNRMQDLVLSPRLQDLAHNNLREEGLKVTNQGQLCQIEDPHNRPQCHLLNSNTLSRSSSSKFSHLQPSLHQCFQESKMEVLIVASMLTMDTMNLLRELKCFNRKRNQRRRKKLQ